MDLTPSVSRGRKCPRQDRSQSGCLFCIVVVSVPRSSSLSTSSSSFGKTIFSLGVKLEVGRLPNLRFEKSLLSPVFLSVQKIVNDKHGKKDLTALPFIVGHSCLRSFQHVCTVRGKTLTSLPCQSFNPLCMSCGAVENPRTKVLHKNISQLSIYMS